MEIFNEKLSLSAKRYGKWLLVSTVDGELEKLKLEMVLNVIDSFDELNWLFGEKWSRFEKSRKEKKA